MQNVLDNVLILDLIGAQFQFVSMGKGICFLRAFLFSQAEHKTGLHMNVGHVMTAISGNDLTG